MRLRPALAAGSAAFALALMALAYSVDFRLPGDQRGYQPVQPIAYSHAVHAGQNAIDCQFCHTGAEKGKHAGIPAASTCMKCHEQVRKDSPEIAKIKTALAGNKPIEWVRVHSLADFVRFDHSRHVNSGVACQSCHGPIQSMDRVSQQMRFSMGQCLACHRGLQHGLDGAVADPLAAKKASTDCVACHY